jgi:hypothetical protein
MVLWSDDQKREVSTVEGSSSEALEEEGEYVAFVPASCRSGAGPPVDIRGVILRRFEGAILCRSGWKPGKGFGGGAAVGGCVVVASVILFWLGRKQRRKPQDDADESKCSVAYSIYCRFWKSRSEASTR